MKLVMLLLLINICSLQVFAQTPITGVVNDLSGNVVEGATVTEKGTQNATVTDSAGRFKITVAGPAASLVISHTGFQSQEVRLGGKATVNVLLAEAASSKLNEVVVVGYGKQ